MCNNYTHPKYEMLLRKCKKNLNKWRDIPCCELKDLIFIITYFWNDLKSQCKSQNAFIEFEAYLH